MCIRGDIGLGNLGAIPCGLGNLGAIPCGLGHLGIGNCGLGDFGLSNFGLGDFGLSNFGLSNCGLGDFGLGATQPNGCFIMSIGVFDFAGDADLNFLVNIAFFLIARLNGDAERWLKFNLGVGFFDTDLDFDFDFDLDFDFDFDELCAKSFNPCWVVRFD